MTQIIQITKRGNFNKLRGRVLENYNKEITETLGYSAMEILYMLRDLPDACCVFKLITDPFGTARDMQFLYVNEKYASLVGKSTAELIGASYFNTVTNRDEDWIRLGYQAAIMRQSVINRTYNTQFNKWFEFWAVPVYQKGFCAFIIHDVTAEKRKEDSREIASKSNNVIIECAKVLSANEFKVGVRAALKILGNVLGASRIGVIQMKGGVCAGEIYDWVDKKSGIGLPSKRIFEKFDMVTLWTSQLGGESVAIIEDSSIISEYNIDIYENVYAGNLTRYILASLSHKGEMIGYLVIDNYSTNLDINIREVVESVAIFISEELRNYNLALEMTYMSAHDVLTELGNRNFFNNTLRMIEGMDIAVGICFADINGLKAINDEFGHDAGDEVIKAASEMFSSIFKKKYCYRIGGDEFVAVIPQITETHFNELIEKLRKKAKKPSLAIGAVWVSKAENVEELVSKADHLMYADKAAFYSDKNDRRHENIK